MARILLMKPIDSEYYIIAPNLGLGYLASALKKDGHDVEIIDAARTRINFDGFRRYIRDNAFDMIGFQLYTYQLNSVKTLASIVKEVSPRTIVVVGGPHPSCEPEHTLNYLSSVDFAVMREGERAVSKLMGLSGDERRSGDSLSKIENLAFRGQNGVKTNGLYLEEDLDSIPFPEWGLIDPNIYPNSPHGTFTRNLPAAPILLTRGCPFDCDFCGGSSIMGKRIRRRGIPNIMEEIKLLCGRFGVRELHIEDDNFSLKKEFVLEFCTALLKSGLNVSWACPNGIRLDTLDKEAVVSMERSGCYSFGVGIESGDDSVLKKIGKNLTTAQVREKIAMVKKNTSIKITGFFLIGHPAEGAAEIEKTIRFSKSLPIDKAAFCTLIPLPGTRVFQGWLKAKGITLGQINWDTYFGYSYKSGVSAIDENTLKKLHRRAIISFYLRPRIIFGLISEIKTFEQVKAVFKRALSILPWGRHYRTQKEGVFARNPRLSNEPAK
ncbi:MAG: radical SAM protein [Candidatus Omnitrophota bacterium]|nr:radical SAM protein [Candidatus Omnitrophota bacterium]